MGLPLPHPLRVPVLAPQDPVPPHPSTSFPSHSECLPSPQVSATLSVSLCSLSTPPLASCFSQGLVSLCVSVPPRSLSPPLSGSLFLSLWVSVPFSLTVCSPHPLPPQSLDLFSPLSGSLSPLSLWVSVPRPLSLCPPLSLGSVALSAPPSGSRVPPLPRLALYASRRRPASRAGWASGPDGKWQIRFVQGGSEIGVSGGNVGSRIGCGGGGSMVGPEKEQVPWPDPGTEGAGSWAPGLLVPGEAGAGHPDSGSDEEGVWRGPDSWVLGSS